MVDPLKQQHLNDAIAAYHKLMIGEHVKLVNSDGTTVEYAPANIALLDSYIQRLRSELGQSTKRRSGTRRMII